MSTALKLVFINYFFIKILNEIPSTPSCRFLLGGEHGRLRYAAPEGYSPLVESLLPQQVLSLEPCFYFGNLAKRALAGPPLVQDDTAFVPTPVDTLAVSQSFVYVAVKTLNRSIVFD